MTDTQKLIEKVKAFIKEKESLKGSALTDEDFIDMEAPCGSKPEIIIEGEYTYWRIDGTLYLDRSDKQLITNANTMNYAVNFSAINLLMNSNAGQAVLTSVRASPEPLTHNEAMTLRELLGHISSTAGIPTPGKKVLEASSEPIATYSSDDYHMVAFKCGFALVEFGKRWTVVRVDGCKGYDYQFDEDYPKTEDTTLHHLDEEYFLDKPWQLRVMMEAEDQLESNNNHREGSLLSKHPEIPNNKIYMNGGHYSFESQIAAQDQWQRALETLSNRQRQTILLWKEGYNQEEIGKLLGVTRSVVSEHFVHAMRKLKEYYSRKTTPEMAGK